MCAVRAKMTGGFMSTDMCQACHPPNEERALRREAVRANFGVLAPHIIMKRVTNPSPKLSPLSSHRKEGRSPYLEFRKIWSLDRNFVTPRLSVFEQLACFLFYS